MLLISFFTEYISTYAGKISAYYKEPFLAHLAHSAKVSFWDRALSVVRRRASCVVCRASTIYLNIFFSDSTGPRVLIFGM